MRIWWMWKPWKDAFLKRFLRTWVILLTLLKIGSRAAIDSNLTPKTQKAIRSWNASSGREATSVTANSERREHIGTTGPVENVCERKKTLLVFNTNDATRNNFSDNVSEMSLPLTHFNRQHTFITWWQDKQSKQKGSLIFPQDFCWNHATHHYTNTKTCRLKRQKVTNSWKETKKSNFTLK